MGVGAGDGVGGDDGEGAGDGVDVGEDGGGDEGVGEGEGEDDDEDVDDGGGSGVGVGGDEGVGVDGDVGVGAGNGVDVGDVGVGVGVGAGGSEDADVGAGVGEPLSCHGPGHSPSSLNPTWRARARHSLQSLLADRSSRSKNAINVSPGFTVACLRRDQAPCQGACRQQHEYNHSARCPSSCQFLLPSGPPSRFRC